METNSPNARVDLLVDGPADAAATIVLAHGAGAGMETPFMDHMASGLAEAGLEVVRFEFPYMRRARREGKRKPPDRAPKLEAAYREVLESLRSRRRLIIGGKSMGGRIASMIVDDCADELDVAGLVCLGYPFHPPGKPERLRTAHLEDLRTPALIVQGTRDPFGRPDEIAGYRLSSSISIHYVEDGDHSLKPRKSSGRNLEQNLADAVQAIVRFADR